VIRFEATQLETLPGNLLERVKAGRITRLVLAPAETSNAGGFTLYRLAVLLN